MNRQSTSETRVRGTTSNARPAARERSFERSGSLRERFHAVIPGGSHTYAKGDDQYPEHMAPYIVRGEGCRIWDVDGNEYIEYAPGMRAVTLGHAFPPVVEAAARALKDGSNFSRPSPIELECAEQLLAMVPAAEMVKFGKNGSDVTTAAVKLARAYTGRDLVAICGDQPFLSVDDWFIGTTPMAAGIPRAIRDLTVAFGYNDMDSVRAVFERHPGRIACVILEPEKQEPPEDAFLHRLREYCHEQGALFVLDEMITGFRWHNGGAQAFHEVEPDLSTFGKAMANGFSVAALAGKREVMRLGGLDHHDRERVFLLSLTHGAETHALAAALETLRVYEREPVVETLWKQGERLRVGLEEVVDDLGLEGHFGVFGRPCCLVYGTRDAEGHPSQPFRTLFLQEIIRRGLIASSLVVSYSHGDEEIDRTVEIIREALVVYRRALEDGVDRYLESRSVQPVFRPYN